MQIYFLYLFFFTYLLRITKLTNSFPKICCLLRQFTAPTVHMTEGFYVASDWDWSFVRKLCPVIIGFSISDKSPPTDWPAEGTIAFDRVFLSYASNEQPVLRNVTLTIGSAEKVRIVCHC